MKNFLNFSASKIVDFRNMNRKAFISSWIVDVWVYTIFVLLIIGFFISFQLAEPTTVLSRTDPLYLSHPTVFFQGHTNFEGKLVPNTDLILLYLKSIGTPREFDYKITLSKALDKLDTIKKHSYQICFDGYCELPSAIKSTNYIYGHYTLNKGAIKVVLNDKITGVSVVVYDATRFEQVVGGD